MNIINYLNIFWAAIVKTEKLFIITFGVSLTDRLDITFIVETGLCTVNSFFVVLLFYNF